MTRPPRFCNLHVIQQPAEAAPARSGRHPPEQLDAIDRFHGLAIGQLRAIRDATFDRRPAAGTTAIDDHLPLVMRGAAETASFGTANRDGEAGMVTAGFVSTLAALVAGGNSREVPPIFVRIAAEGVAQPGGNTRRSFGELVFASFAETLKDPKKYPQATMAFHAATQALARALAERTIAALESVDSGLSAILSHLDTLSLLASDTASTVHRIDERVGRTDTKGQFPELGRSPPHVPAVDLAITACGFP